MSDAPQPAASPEPTPASDAAALERQRWIIAGVVAAAVLLLAAIVVAAIAMLRHPVETETIRDIVIVFTAAEGLVIGIALIILIVQLARLTALIQNEVKPILDSTNETLNTFRGTTAFLSDNLAQPVIRASGTLSAIRRAFDLLRFGQ
jgi:hypothetical protein